MKRKANQLIAETSPYLLQHAYNPVNWYPWGPAALERAQRDDKPILLSIGYSACHWCHVMERESFENEEIARFMNERFINIKVDREERPDLDEIYMTAVQLITGQGGWPLTVFLVPDLKPFYGGTYFPPEDRWGRPGFRTVLQSIIAIYEKERHRVVEQSEKLTQHLQNLNALSVSQAPFTLLTPALLQRAYAHSLENFDRAHGGFSSAPKFPHSMELSFLLRYGQRTADRDAQQMVEQSLEKMGRGGIYDQLGGGFHRYSVDAQWRVPHFEKMLYDNALLVWTYLEAYQATKKSFYRRVVEETLEYVLREMTSPDGGFYASQDADSPEGEGAFFVWTPQEIKTVLGERDGALACEYFGVTETGNFEHGASVLHCPYSDEAFAARTGMDAKEFVQWRTSIKQRLFQARERRAKPARDEKILTAWNGLMISAFARAYQILGREEYLNAAKSAAQFCLLHLKHDRKLSRCYKDGQAKLNGYLEDYAFFITALLDLYEASFDLIWLKEALALSQTMIEQFWDEASGGFFFTSRDHEALPVRSRSAYDGASPSGTSAALFALLRLAEFTDSRELRAKAEQTLRLYREPLERAPGGFSHMLCALDFYLGPVAQIAVVGFKHDARTRKILEVVQACFRPNKIVALAGPEQLAEYEQFSPLFVGKTMRDDASTVYLCQNYACAAPITEPEALEKALQH